eukprot:532151-Hanusia_phi.AAC.2
MTGPVLQETVSLSKSSFNIEFPPSESMFALMTVLWDVNDRDLQNLSTYHPRDDSVPVPATVVTFPFCTPRMSVSHKVKIYTLKAATVATSCDVCA